VVKVDYPRRVADLAGDFKIHLTLPAYHRTNAVDSAVLDGIAAFADREGLTFSHIVLDRGWVASQPTLTVRAVGILPEVEAIARQWTARIEADQPMVWVVRTKITAAPGNDGVPRTDRAARAARPDSPERYFEHHVKVLLPAGAGGPAEQLIALTDIATGYGARPSRNARRRRPDGQQERFVTQRCRRVGRAAARARLDELVAGLSAAGFSILEVEQEYVVHDDALGLDSDWLEPDHRGPIPPPRDGPAPAAGGAGFPDTYQPVPADPGVRQRVVFDPALKQFQHAFVAGEPRFDRPDTGRQWQAARRAAMEHVLGVVARMPQTHRLVLRGSVPLRAWLGPAAREPGDLDFVAVAGSRPFNRRRAAKLIGAIRSAVARTPGAGLDPDGVRVSRIWTYERASGQRLVFPFAAPGVPAGIVQMDVVFNEPLPVAPVRASVVPGGVSVLVAPPELALAWKLLWLQTDTWRQGKDLYDATLLAEHVRVPAGLVHTVLGEHGAHVFGPDMVMGWRIDWGNFQAAHPAVEGDAQAWQRRLARALSHLWV